MPVIPPPDINVTGWDELYRAFPIKKDQHLNVAIGWLLSANSGISDPPPHCARARAWVAYCCATAVLDLWPNSDASWGPFQNLTRAQLRTRAINQSNRALSELPADPGDYDFAYDVFWAAGFVDLYQRNFAQADRHWNDALTYNEGDLPVLVADYADALVFFGLPSVGRFMVTQAIASLSGSAPDWLHWVQGWAYVGMAAQYLARFGAGNNASELAAKNAITSLDNLQPYYDGGIPLEFDAAIPRLMARFVLDGAQDEALWQSYQAVVGALKGRDWWLSNELERSPFHSNNGATQIRSLMELALPDAPVTQHYLSFDKG